MKSDERITDIPIPNECKNCIFSAFKQFQTRWIAVEDELPKEGERVLVTDSDGTIEIANYVEYASDDGGIEWWSNDYQVHPIAWMPLPKPYERSENEK